MSMPKIKTPAPPTPAPPSGDLEIDALLAVSKAERLLCLPPDTMAKDPTETPEMLAVQVLMQHFPAIGRMCLAGGMVSAGLAVPLATVLEATWSREARFSLARALVETLNAEGAEGTEQSTTEQP